MRRILPILILLGIAAGALAVNPYLEVVARKNAGGATPTLIFSEDFDNPGYENAWTESDPANAIDDQSTAQSVTGSYSAYIAPAEGTNHFAYYDFGASSGLTDYVVRVHFFISPGGTDQDGAFIILDDNTADPDNDDNMGHFLLTPSSGFTRFLGDGGVINYTASTGVWNYTEFHYPSGDWRVNGVAQTSNPDPTVTQAQYIMFGEDSGAGDGAEFYVDGIGLWDTTGVTGEARWPGPAN